MTDYLVVGHVTRDIVDGQERPGGTALYAALLAARWGLKTGVVTAADPAWLEGAVFDWAPEFRPDRAEGGGGLRFYVSGAGRVCWAVRVADVTTTFENVYTPAGRRQRLRARSETLGPDDIPAGWRPRILHLGPVAGELGLTADWARVKPRFLGCTAQGWLRRFRPDGTVESRWRPELEPLLGRFDAVVVSAEDLGPDLQVAAEAAGRVRYLVVTRAEAGVDLWVGGRRRHVPAFWRPAVDPTGAGDVFAAALFIRLAAGDDPVRAAQTAAMAASLKVGRLGPAGVPGPESVEAELRRALEFQAKVPERGDSHGRN